VGAGFYPAPPGATPASSLDELVKTHSQYFNVSISVAITLASGETFAAAYGANDRVSGTPVTTASQYPGGSVTKTFTSAAALKLVEAGKLDLDEPAHQIVDPWLQAQGLPTLLEVFNGDPKINLVTPRQLFSMRAGVRDYNDRAVRQFTIDHPQEDFLPMQFMTSITNTTSSAFLFKPGSGGSYSGVSYVLGGWVLAAAAGVASWEELDQKRLIEAPPLNTSLPGFQFDQGRFMGRGLCSQYRLPPVVHQYLYDPSAAAARGPLRPSFTNASRSPPRGAQGHCESPTSKDTYNNTHLVATEIGRQAVAPESGAAACCALADSVHGVSYWEFNANATDALCIFYSGYASQHMTWRNATAGKADPVVRQTDFLDVYDASCLNGWTMGNIATTPSDITRFYHALFSGAFLSADSLAQMMTWAPLTQGFSTGTPYGMGLMKQSVQAAVDRSCKALPDCACNHWGACTWNTAALRHVGLDYGSGFPFLGFLPALGASFALATNSGEMPLGMNSTLRVSENKQLVSAISCDLLQLLVQMALPEGDAPTLLCQHT